MPRSPFTDDETGLTPREQRVLCLIAVGMTNEEIAALVSKGGRPLSVKTIDSHRGNLMKKLLLKNNQQLTLWALKRGWIDVDGNVLRIVPEEG